MPLLPSSPQILRVIPVWPSGPLRKGGNQGAGIHGDPGTPKAFKKETGIWGWTVRNPIWGNMHLGKFAGLAEGRAL